MKYFIVSGLSVLLLLAAPAAYAQTAPLPLMPVTSSSPATANISITPFDLVSLSYQGFLVNEGIPKFGQLIFSYRAGQVAAEDLVRAAINTRRLSPDTLNNHRYLAAVSRQLDSLYNNSSN
ncbi:MAG: hypothetical protein SFY66_08895 [Oculatellaceae cyanobacterium bins.114]|nr:hypothetical protein [Oculatellaceae cyanobacterium bins.114]